MAVTGNSEFGDTLAGLNDSIAQAASDGQLGQAVQGMVDNNAGSWTNSAIAGYDAAQQGLSLGQAETANLNSFQTSPIGFVAGYTAGYARSLAGHNGGGVVVVTRSHTLMYRP
ncbi:hypothetical protein [Paraburkholderia sp. CNPSo 3281]|uniref:hypothetical protein n=1 Tax=Paraburkholderia sp. CNPSo 3281 TaxID=2940933 RepID=UPI0020B87B54|nr:hypothetical protein [Paraburkholderia sp. CNPSo 3281]MCP3715781.1 hypothetical protein [Paraburkholderia sp. CNPSo 3281]